MVELEGLRGLGGEFDLCLGELLGNIVGRGKGMSRRERQADQHGGDKGFD